MTDKVFINETLKQVTPANNSPEAVELAKEISGELNYSLILTPDITTEKVNHNYLASNTGLIIAILALVLSLISIFGKKFTRK